MRAHRWHIACLVALLFAGCVGYTQTVPGSTASGPPGERGGSHRAKEVVCRVEPIPNYVVHMTALAGLPWPTPYGDLMADTVPGDALARLRRAAPALTWDREHTGELAPWFVFLPAYLRIDDEFALEQYFIDLEDAIRSNSYLHLREAHTEGHDRVSRWLFSLQDFFDDRLDFYHDGFTFIRELGRLYVALYPAYERDLWPQIETDLESTAQELEGQAWSVDLIATWERLTGERFDGRRFHVNLVAAPTSIAATGLSYGETLVSVGDETDLLMRTVSFEFGRHLLIEVFNEAVAEAADRQALDWTVFAAYHGLAEYYNRRIFPGYREEIDNDIERFVAAFASLHDQRPQATARELMRQGLVAVRNEQLR